MAHIEPYLTLCLKGIKKIGPAKIKIEQLERMQASTEAFGWGGGVVGAHG